MMFKSWKILDQKNGVIKSLWIVIGLLVCLNIYLTFNLSAVPNRLRIFVPPDLSRGAMIQPGNIPKSTIYSFAFQIFTAINSWPQSGDKEYGKNINSYRNYLSPSFYQQLIEDKQTRTTNGELQRKRIMSGVSGYGYKPSDVKALGNGTWLVNIHLQIMEYLEGSVIKNVIMDYPIMVSRVHDSITVNPWGLTISGFSGQPYRTKTIV